MNRLFSILLLMLAVFSTPCTAKPKKINQLEKKYDLIVVGGGPAGIGAALMAGKLGLKTLVIEKNGALGGVWTSGLLCYVMDQKNKTGVNKRIIAELNKAKDGEQINPESLNYRYHPETMKYVLEKLMAEFKVDYVLHSKLVDVVVKNKKIVQLRAGGMNGIETYSADYYVDATGNGDLGAFAGASFEIGHPETGLTQPMTLMALVSGIDSETHKDYIYGLGKDARNNFLKLLQDNDIHPTYEMPTLWKVDTDLYGLMAHHSYKKSALSTVDVTQATASGRKEIFELTQKLRQVKGWERLQLVATAEQIGIREGRRINGLYKVQKEDLLTGRKHADAVCTVTFKMDVHSTDPTKSKSVGEENSVRTKDYDIPSGALISKDIDNLLMAGRCISGDFFAHSSYRVTGNSVAIGEGAAYIAYLYKNNVRYGDAQWNSRIAQMADFRLEIMK